MRRLVIIALQALALTAAADGIELVSPIDGETVVLLPPAQKTVLAMEDREERIAWTKSARKEFHSAWKQSSPWRTSLPLVLTVRTPRGVNGPWKVLIGRESDLSDARTWYLQTSETDAATGRETGVKAEQSVSRIVVPRANLEIGTRYYWKVICRGRCGFGCGPHHGCKPCGRLSESPVGTFVTEDLAPRWILVEGNVGNFRDFGGRCGMNGARVRQGMIYRGQGLNDNSVTGEEPGRNRLTMEDVRYLTETLGIRTDLDLRGVGETAGLASSPLGRSVNLIVNPSFAYREAFQPKGKRMMAENFRIFCDRKNYPVYFHCIGGADRTGVLAYVLNGVLGVSRREAETDWESTFYPSIPDETPDKDYWCRESHFDTGLAAYGDETVPWCDKVVLYLKDCGVTDAEIAAFRAIMLGGSK